MHGCDAALALLRMGLLARRIFVGQYDPVSGEGGQSMELGVLEQAIKRAYRVNPTDPLVTVAADSKLSPELAKAARSLGSREPSVERRNKLRGSAEQWA